MKTLRIALVVGLCLTAAGCRLAQRQQQVTALERQNRLLEDEIYRLRWMVEDYELALQRCQDGPSGDQPDRQPFSILNPAGGRSSGAPSSTAAGTADGAPPVSLGPPNASEATPPPIPSTGGAVDGETGGGDAPSWSPPGDEADESLDDAPAYSPGSAGGGESSSLRPPLEEARPRRPGPLDDSRDVQDLRLDPAACRGWDGDGRPGDDGLLAVVQPLDAEGRRIWAAAPISLVLLDPTEARQGKEARIARWDFSAEEVAAAIRASDRGDGIPLRIRWGENPPANDQLHLFAQLRTADKRRVEADAPVRVAVAGSAVSPGEEQGRRAGWKPAPPRPLEHGDQPMRMAQRGDIATSDTAQDSRSPVNSDSEASQSAPPIEQGQRSEQSAPQRREGSQEPTDAEASTANASTAKPDRPKLKPPVWSPER